MSKNTTTTINKSQPYTAQVGRLRIAVFENVSGKGQVFWSTFITRPYYHQKAQEWRDGSFSEEDLDDLTKAKNKATAYINTRKEAIGPSQMAR